MLAGDFGERTLERALSTQPFIDDNAQSVLVTSEAWSALKLLGGHIGNSSCHLLRRLRASALSKYDQTKIAELHFVSTPEQYVLRLDIPMNQFFLMGIIQG
jgi:hypothetical protein